MNAIEYIRKDFQTTKGQKFQVTLCEIKGEQPGPALTLIAGQHGMEHMGPIVLTRFIDEISKTDFCGTLRICPCANPLALELDYEFYPENEDLSVLDNYYYSRFRHYYCPYGLGRQDQPNYYNMNRIWNREGELGVTGGITRWLWEEACENADALIDFHCLQGKKALVYTYDEKSVNFIADYGIPGIYTCPEPNEFKRGGLAWQVSSVLGIPAAIVEFSAQHELKEGEFELGRRGILNIMKKMNMLSGNPLISEPVYKITNTYDFYSKAKGHIHIYPEQYAQIKKGDKLYDIRDCQTLEIIDSGYSSVDGIMGYITYRAVNDPNDLLCCINEVELLRGVS
jgi:predicted deacylase